MKYIGENALGHILNLASGMETDLTQAARAYYEEIVVPIDGTEVESRHINPTGMIVPNNSVVFLVGRFIINGTTYNFSTTTLLIYAKTTLYNLSATPASDSIKRTVQITIKSDGPPTYKLTAGTNSKLGDTTVQIRMIVLNVSYMQGTYKYDKVLANNSWAQIAEASKNGCANMLWNIGDEKDVLLSDGETVTVQIAGFYHDTLTDYSGNAGITFICKDLTNSSTGMNNDAGVGNLNGWRDSMMRSLIESEYYEKMPEDLQSVIRYVYKDTGVGGVLNPDDCSLDMCVDDLFLLSVAEVGGDENTLSVTPGEGKPYPIFTDDNSRIKEACNGTAGADYWWLRSPRVGSDTDYYYVDESGQCAWGLASNASLGICFGFCV